jgi:hypothetical protein
MNRVVLAAAAGIGLSLGFAAPAHADGDWAAIAYSANADYWEVAWGPATQAQAEAKAMKGCGAKASDCQIVATSASCVALADEPNAVHGGIGATAQAASTDALSRAPSGAKVVVAKCSTDP